MTHTETLAYLYHIPLEKKFWFLVCLIGSGIAWMAIRLTTMKRLANLMGAHHANLRVSMLADKEQILKAHRIGRMMTAVGKNVPWECKCLSEALCVKWLLNFHNIPSVFYLGAKLDAKSDKGMKAHAWISVERYNVIGGPGNRAYQVVASFTTPEL